MSATATAGKISRVLAAKCALAIRVDALGDSADAAIGIDARAKVGCPASSRLGGNKRGLAGPCRTSSWGNGSGCAPPVILAVHVLINEEALLARTTTAQVEARLRQLEGKTLADEGAKPKGKEQPGKYDKTKANGSAVAAAPKAYNADADVAVPEKKVGGCQQNGFV